MTDDALLEWAIDKRFMNGTQTMVIDMNKCVRCDDCVRACSATHGVTRGSDVKDKYLIVGWSQILVCIARSSCMIGCPTGAFIGL